jgi:pimeloyl-ACP methyl ester carboxylesterase
MMDSTKQFIEMQGKLLAFYGVKAASRFLDLRRPSLHAHVLEAGEGEPLVLLHGGDGEAVNWAPLMGPLQAHARLYAVDRPGFGLTDAFDYRGVNLREHAADFVISVLDSLGIESATLVGGSMGGFFVLAASLAHPERVRRIVLVGYAVGAVRTAPLMLRLICGVPGLARLFMKGRPTMEAQRKQYRKMFHVDVDKIPDLFLETRIAGIRLPSELGGRTGIPTWAQLLPRAAGLRGVRREVFLGDELPRIQSPSLMIMGQYDMAPPEAGRAVMAGIPGGRFEYLPGIGHFPFLEAAERTAELIVEFLRSGSRESIDRPAEGAGSDLRGPA